MPNTTWRDEWPAFGAKLIDETARCFANQQAAVTTGRQPDWVPLTSEQQKNPPEAFCSRKGGRWTTWSREVWSCELIKVPVIHGNNCNTCTGR